MSSCGPSAELNAKSRRLRAEQREEAQSSSRHESETELQALFASRSKLPVYQDSPS